MIKKRHKNVTRVILNLFQELKRIRSRIRRSRNEFGMTVMLSVILLLVFLSPVQSAARQFNSIELIEKAYRSGEIKHSEALNYKVSAVLRPESLPVVYRSNVIIKSATSVLMEARLNKHLLSHENERMLARGRITVITDLYGSGITLQSHASPQGRFRLHFTTDNKYGDAVPPFDVNGDGVPDYVERFAKILDNVWTNEVELMGYDAPPSDGTEGGDCLLDVYLADLNAYGYTQIEDNDPVSMVYMLFENDFSLYFPPNTDPEGDVIGAMKAVAAHEFFHTIQFQITGDICTNGWWMEASSTWIEDYVYPDVNDYINYIDYWFQHPQLPVNTYDCTGSNAHTLFPYGTTIWIRHMTDKYGSEFVYDVWNKIKAGTPDVSALSAVIEALTDRGTTLEEELKELRVANVTMTYEDAFWYQSWQSVNSDPNISPIEVAYSGINPDFSSSVAYTDVPLLPLATKYYSFSAPQGSGNLSLDFNGSGNISVMVIGFNTGDTAYDVTEILTDVNNEGALTIKGFGASGQYSRVVVIPVNYSETSSGSFILTASYDSTYAGNISSVDIKPDTASIVTGDNGINGKQQYYLIIRDNSNRQVLQDEIAWSDNSPYVNMNDNGLADATGAVSGATIIAALPAYSSYAQIYALNPAFMSPGTPRLCVIDNGNATNRSPSITPLGSISIAEGSNLIFVISAVDPDGDPITYNVAGLPSGATFNRNSGEFNWSPNFIQAGTYNLVFTASDGFKGTSEVVTITVTDNEGNDSRCFIATAAFGSPLHPYVGLLREFRDLYLLTNSSGRWIVSLYYGSSPPIAEIISDNPGLKVMVKLFLIPAIIISWFLLKTTLIAKIVIAALMLISINIISIMLRICPVKS